MRAIGRSKARSSSAWSAHGMGATRASNMPWRVDGASTWRVRASSSAVSMRSEPSRWRWSSALGIPSSSCLRPDSSAVARTSSTGSGVRIGRCYDPRRMSSAPARNLPSLGRALRGIAWTALFAVMAAGAAGLIAEASHTPGSPSRADLTAEGDLALVARLGAASGRLSAISTNVDGLADAAKTALEEITSADPTKLQQALEHGGELAASITTDTSTLQVALAGLPGDEPDAVLRYSNDVLVRRAATLAALDAAAALQASFEQVTARALEASGVTTLIAQHDQIVLAAAAQGRSRQYSKAAVTLDQAIQTVVAVKEQRTKLIADPGETVLDAWIERNRDYDLALQGVYLALVASNGNPNTVRVARARAAERAAFNQLPPD